MNNGLYTDNTLQNFWKIATPIDDVVWEQAVSLALAELNLPCSRHNAVLAWTLGEGSYGNQAWRLSFAKQVYYLLKPFIPQSISKRMRRVQTTMLKKSSAQCEHWPIDNRYVNYLWSVLANVMEMLNYQELEMIGFWPERKQNAFVLTHDIETVDGQKFVQKVLDAEAEFGFRSAFFFVPYRYPVDMGLIDEIKARGGEVGIHGYNHDGKLFRVKGCTLQRCQQINQFADSIKAKSFRAPLTLRDPDQMQYLNCEYDLSFFDTDPFEPMPGGTMSVFPFSMGKLLELPYTLPQDYTCFEVLNQHTIKIWLDKCEFLKQVHGMILLDSHPDYLQLGNNLTLYQEFLASMQAAQDSFFHGLPVEVGIWWKERAVMPTVSPGMEANLIKVWYERDTHTLSFGL